MISLKDCGAIPGQPVDDALRKAIDVVAEGRESTVFWDNAYKLTRECRQSFLTTKGKHLNLLGDGARSKILPTFPVNQHGMVFQNLETCTIKNLAVVGNGKHEFDCGNLFYLSSIKQLVWDSAHIYGLASPAVNYFGLVFIDSCGLDMSRSLISGSTSVKAGLFTLRRFRRVHITSVDVVDYGEIDGGREPHGTFHSKTSLGFTHSWFRFVDPQPPGTSSYLGVPQLQSLKLDEGARYAISCEAKVFSPPTAPETYIRGIRLRDVGINVRHSGLLLDKVESVAIDDSYFTWQLNPCLAIEGMDVKRLRLTNSWADKNATTIQLRRSRPITPSDPVDRLVLDECDGFTVNAPKTLVTHLPAKPSKIFAIEGPSTVYLDLTALSTSNKGDSTMDGILLMIREALTSKKFVVTVAATISAAAMKIGLELPTETVAAVLTPIVAYLLAQGLADHGKEAAKVTGTIDLATSMQTSVLSEQDKIPQPVKDKLL